METHTILEMKNYREVLVKDRKPEVGKKVIGIGVGICKDVSTVRLNENGYWDSMEWESECDEPEFWLEEIPDLTTQLKADKVELLEALENIVDYGGIANFDTLESLIQKMKKCQENTPR